MEPRRNRLRFVGIGGSLRSGSCTYQVLHVVAERLRARGCDIEIFDLRRRVLPFCNGNKKDPRKAYPDVEKLRRLVSDSHGLVLATPEYHGSVSGVLKNVIDLLDHEHLEGKVVGGISVMGGVHSCNALNDLRRIMRWCHAWMIPEQLAVPHSATAFSGERLVADDLEPRIEAFVKSLVKTSLRMNDFFRSDLMTE